jgi:hypothetical protein
MTEDHPPVTDGDPTDGSAPAHEPILLDESSTADLRLKVTEAWQEFARALADRLGHLPSGAHLEITLDPTASGTGDALYSVGLERSSDGPILARAVGNSALPEGYRLDRAAVAAMIALGWSPPGVIEGSGEYFGLRGEVAGAARLATIVTRTLRDVYGAPHPAFLVFQVHGADGEVAPIIADPLGPARPDATGRERAIDVDGTLDLLGRGATGDPGMPLEEQVRMVIATLLKSPPDELQVDSDGDIGIRAGSAMVFVRVRDNPPLVDVFSPVLTEVEPTEQLYVRLSELTNRMPIGRLYCTNDTVWASVPVFGRNFQPAHLMLAVQVMTGLADELDDRLHGEFGGRRFFGDGDKPANRERGEHRTGMYL